MQFQVKWLQKLYTIQKISPTKMDRYLAEINIPLKEYDENHI